MALGVVAALYIALGAPSESGGIRDLLNSNVFSALHDCWAMQVCLTAAH